MNTEPTKGDVTASLASTARQAVEHETMTADEVRAAIEDGLAQVGKPLLEHPQDAGTVETDGQEVAEAAKHPGLEAEAEVEADLSMPVSGDDESGAAAADMREREAEDAA